MSELRVLVVAQSFGNRMPRWKRRKELGKISNERNDELTCLLLLAGINRLAVEVECVLVEFNSMFKCKLG